MSKNSSHYINSDQPSRYQSSLLLDPLATSSTELSPPPLSFINPQNDQQQQTDHIVYRLALTGGPCSGKTTGQARISTFFENLGWKVYRVPETATTLFSGGIRFPEMSQEEAETFQENLIRVMISIERTFFQLALTCKRNCLIICDRGVMDATAYMSEECWQRFLRDNKWNTVDLRDNRYNQVIHLVTSADGAEEYYNIEGNPVRTEGLELARQLDRKTMEAWVGHPYMDVIDNSTDFDTKMRRMIAALCRRIGIEADDRLKDDSHKIKFLVKKLPDNDVYPSYQDFDVVHDYLKTSNPKIQSRIRKRGQKGNWSYQQTIRRSDAGSQLVELRRQITHRDYVTLLSQRDENHHTIFKTRRCFLWQQTYFQMDIYHWPHKGLILLEAYTTLSGDALKAKLPKFLDIEREVTDDPEYSMFELSKLGHRPHNGSSHANSPRKSFDSSSDKHNEPILIKSRKMNDERITSQSSSSSLSNGNSPMRDTSLIIEKQENKINDTATLMLNDDNNNTIKSKTTNTTATNGHAKRLN